LNLYSIKVDLSSYKIHLATGSEYSPLDAFFEGNFQNYQADQQKKNFECNHVIGLISLGSNKWLFAGVYRINGSVPRDGRHFYDTELLAGQECVIGRLIIQHGRTSRATYLWGSQDKDELYKVSEYRAKPMTVGEFPGYHATSVPYRILKTIVEQNVSSWRGALTSLKGVYLIADTVNGAKYVGSALGTDGLWQRWSSYVFCGHGGNVELRSLLKEKGDDYVKNFRYSILEIADSHASDQYVLERESYWKEVLLTRSHGYNKN